jgi:hypothetical protein
MTTAIILSNCPTKHKLTLLFTLVAKPKSAGLEAALSFYLSVRQGFH